MTEEAAFGKYTIIGHLGSGGMAEVFKCRLSGIGGFDKVVVVKRIRPEFVEDPDFVPMFLDEARIAANLNHPNVISVFEIGEVDGAPYIAMEYVRGPTLSSLVRAARKTGKHCIAHPVKIIAGIAEGLHYAHNARDANDMPLGIVHRDVSPQNILVSTNGTPKLLDFGVAKAAGRLSRTQVGMFKGKLRYTAPEQLQGIGVDFRSDIYSLGLCLYESTTGHQRFHSKSEPEMLKEALQGHIQPPSNFLPDYPRELEEILLWALEPDREKRCPSAHDLSQALEQFIASGPHASSTSAVARWVAEVFPDSGTNPYGKSYGTTPSGRSSPDDSSKSSRRQGAAVYSRSSVAESDLDSVSSSHGVAHTRRSHHLLIAGGALLALLTLGGIVLALRPGASPTPPPVASQVQPTPAPAPALSGPDATLRAYLDEAESLASAHRYGPALELVAKAREVKGSVDPSLNIRLARLSDRVERDAMLAKARRALETMDSATAMDAAKRVLSRDPENKEAMRIFDDARKLSAPPPAQEVHRPASRLAAAKPAGSIAARENSPAPPPSSALAMTSTQAAPEEPSPRSISEPPPPAAAQPPPPAVSQPPPPAVSQAPAPAAAQPLPPRLPPKYSARSAKDLARVFSVVEGEAIERGHVPAAAARAAFRPLLNELLRTFAPGQEIELYPRAMFYFVVKEVASGRRQGDLGEQLRRAHLDGSLQSRGGS